MGITIKKREDDKKPLIKQVRSEEGIEKTLKVVEGFKVTDDDRIIGKHTFGNLYRIDKNVIEDIEFLKKIVLESINISRMKLVDIKAWNFGGDKGGVTVIAVIQESHIALHTWKEYDYATVDIYTCGDQSDPNKAFDHIVKALKPKRHQRFNVDRSQIEFND